MIINVKYIANGDHDHINEDKTQEYKERNKSVGMLLLLLLQVEEVHFTAIHQRISDTRSSSNVHAKQQAIGPVCKEHHST